MITTMGIHAKDSDLPTVDIVQPHDGIRAPYLRVRLGEDVILFPSPQYLTALIDVLLEAQADLADALVVAE